MTFRGHIENGKVLVDEATPLPEGARVVVEVVKDDAQFQPRPQVRARRFQPIEMPGGPLADDLIQNRR